jgi:hypothetical protein
MEIGLDTFLGWGGLLPTVLLTLGIYAICVTLRKAAEGIFYKYDLARNTYWRDVALPVLPPFIGMLCGLASKFPYPSAISGRMSHVLYGLLCGFFSGHVYRFVKGLVVKKWGIQLDGPPSSGRGPKPDGAGSPSASP